MVRGFYLIIAILIFMGASFEVNAHSIGRSSSYWTPAGDGYDVRWSISPEEYQSLSEDGGVDLVRAAFSAMLQEQACDIQTSSNLGTVSPGQDVELTFRVTCAPDGISLSGLFDLNPSHVHLLHFADGLETSEILFTNDRSSFDLAGGNEAQASSIWQYLKLGFSHILEGYDHLAFVLALMLVVSSIRPLFWAITGFTLGHSITLALGSLGLLAARPEIVEPIIAFTIAFTVMDSVIARSRDAGRWFVFGGVFVLALAAAEIFIASMLPLIAWAGLGLMTLSIWAFSLQGEEKARKVLPLVTLGFGLIHGFGFAGVLSELGLPADGKFTALLGFNLGVEAGQIAFVLVIFVLLQFSGLFKPKTLERIRHLVAFALIGLGLFWFVERIFL